MANEKGTFLNWVGFKEGETTTQNSVDRIRELEAQLADLRSRRDITSLSKEEFESILRKLFNSQEYHIPLKYPSYILSGTTMYLDNNENKVLENVRNASVIIQIFSKLAEPMLDMYSKKQYGMPYANLSPDKNSSANLCAASNNPPPFPCKSKIKFFIPCAFN